MIATSIFKNHAQFEGIQLRYNSLLWKKPEVGVLKINNVDASWDVDT